MQALKLQDDANIEEVIPAKYDGDRVICGKCGGLLMVRYGRFVCFGNNAQKAAIGAIKCKRHNKGKTCNAVNEIEL